MGVPEAAGYLGVTLRTVYGRIDLGEIPAYRLGRVIRIRKDERGCSAKQRRARRREELTVASIDNIYMTAERARRLTDDIKTAVAMTWELVEKAYRGRGQVGLRLVRRLLRSGVPHQPATPASRGTARGCRLPP